MHYYTYGPGYGVGFGVLSAIGGLLHLIFWIIVIMIIIRVIRGRKGGDWRMFRHSHPLDILKERYAKGEIDKAEFEEKKKDLI